MLRKKRKEVGKNDLIGLGFMPEMDEKKDIPAAHSGRNVLNI